MNKKIENSNDLNPYVSTDSKIQAITFEIEGESYGIDIISLDEIIQMVALKPIPQAPDFLEGVINLRGEIFPVIDIRKQFGLPKREITLETRIIIASFHSRRAGFIVDGVREVIELNKGTIQIPVVDSKQARFIGGMAKLDDGTMIQLIKIDKILDEDHLQQLSKVVINETKFKRCD